MHDIAPDCSLPFDSPGRSGCRTEGLRGSGTFEANLEDTLQNTQMTDLTKRLWRNEEGQDIAEYAVMLAVILVIVIGTIRLIGGNANNVFSSVASGISQ